MRSRDSSAIHALLTLLPLMGASMLLVACGGDPSTGADGGVDAGGDAGLVATPPDIPWLEAAVPPVALTPCPPGWRETAGAAVTECDPYPEAGPAVCPDGQAHFPGEAGCRPVGEACPVGDYAAGLPSDGTVIYVNAAAPSGGDGSLGAPYDGLAGVPWLSLAPGRTVALAAGWYPGSLPLRPGVEVVGACAAETHLSGVDGPVQKLITVTAAGEPAGVRDVTIASSRQFAVYVGGGGARELLLRGVVIEGARLIAVSAVGEGAVVRIEDSVIRDTRPGAADRALGRALDVETGGRIEATRVILERNREIAVHIAGAGSTAVLSDVVVRETRSQSSDGAYGRGITVEAGARLEASRLLLASNRDVALVALGAGTAVELADVLIQGTESEEFDGSGGRGISLSLGAALNGTRVVVAQNREVGIYAGGADTSVTLSDAVVRDTAPQVLRDEGGRSLNIQGGARFDGSRILLASSHEVGIYDGDEGTEVTLTDAVVQDTGTAASPQGGGRAISLQGGARLEGTRLLVTRSHEAGILAAEAGSQAVLADVVVHDSRSRLGGRGGTGVHVQTGAHLVGERIVVDGAALAGVTATAGSTANLTDVTVARVTPAPCDGASCPEVSFGYGAVCIGSALSMRRFVVREAALCGVFVSPSEVSTDAANLELEGGVVSGATIGACVQVEGYDLGRLTNDVEYRDNGTNLDATMLPVPSLVGSPAE